MHPDSGTMAASAQGGEAPATVTLEHAMALYDMHSFELLWEKALDTKVQISDRFHQLMLVKEQ